jgi:hypothetical protein
MHDRMNQQKTQSSQSSPQEPTPKTKAGDYIDFEEVK